VRNAGADQGAREIAIAGHVQALSLQPSPASSLGHEHLVLGDVVNYAGHDLAGALEGDGHCEVRHAVEEVRGPVQWVHHEARVPVGTDRGRALLGQEPVAWMASQKERTQKVLRLAIGRRDEVRPPLELDLELRPPVKPAEESRPGAPGGFHHRLEIGRGSEHSGRILPNAR